MDRYLITKCIKAAISVEEELKFILIDMSDIVLNEISTLDEKSGAYNTMIECISPFINESDINNLYMYDSNEK